MSFDNLTTTVLVWAIATVVAVIAASACNGCCIAKILRKPCKH